MERMLLIHSERRLKSKSSFARSSNYENRSGNNSSNSSSSCPSCSVN
ncbi:hypothetical protein [Paenibacillus vortex]|nr:hypothetical protein [Paenibacillus vortex]